MAGRPGKNLIIMALTLAAAASLTGCANDGWEVETGSIGEPLALSGESPSADDVDKGREYFAAGSYGLAEKHFRRAVEANPRSVGAWVGLAAAYDQMSRFDLAERAYRKALALNGRTPLLLNNYGYHYLLSGNKARARQILNESARLDPNDPTIQTNLHLLENWSYADEPQVADRRHR